MSTAFGWYIEFQAAVLRQLPRPDEIGQTAANGWCNNQASLKKNLAGCLLLYTSDFLRLLSASEEIIISETDGTKTLANATDVFTGYISPDFTNSGLDVPSEARPKTPVRVYELVKNGRFNQFFSSSGGLDKLCLTQDQIIQFCLEHKNWLRTGGFATFFLFKVEGQFWVVHVRFDAGGRLMAIVNGFSSVNVWRAGYGHRIVVPQLVRLES